MSFANRKDPIRPVQIAHALRGGKHTGLANALKRMARPAGAVTAAVSLSVALAGCGGGGGPQEAARQHGGQAHRHTVTTTVPTTAPTTSTTLPAYQCPTEPVPSTVSTTGQVLAAGSATQGNAVSASQPAAVNAVTTTMEAGVASIGRMCVDGEYSQGTLVSGDFNNSLQFNNVLQVGGYFYYVQNVAIFNTASLTVSFESSIWALGQGATSTVGPAVTPVGMANYQLGSLTGNGRLLSSGQVPFYAYTTSTSISYSMSPNNPLNIALITQVDASGNLVFAYKIGARGTVTYDKVGIGIPGQALFINSGNNYNQSYLWGNGATQLVFGGNAGQYDAEYSAFTASTAIYYMNSSGSIVPFTSVQQTGVALGTAEGDVNLSWAVANNGVVQISTGMPDSSTYRMVVNPPPFSSELGSTGGS